MHTAWIAPHGYRASSMRRILSTWHGFCTQEVSRNMGNHGAAKKDPRVSSVARRYRHWLRRAPQEEEFEYIELGFLATSTSLPIYVEKIDVEKHGMSISRQ